MDLGKTIDTNVIQAGLKELCQDIYFDVVNNRPDDWHYTLQLQDEKYRRAIEANRMPVMHLDKYVCSLDRGMVPEIMVWTTVEKMQKASCEPYADGAFYSRTASVDSTYREQVQAMEAGDGSYQLNGDGTITHWWAMVPVKAKGRCMFVGWRHTFERLIVADIPGVNRKTIGDKFGVDMFKSVTGPMEELLEAAMEE